MKTSLLGPLLGWMALAVALGLAPACAPSKNKSLGIQKAAPSGDAAVEKAVGVGNSCAAQLTGKTEDVLVEDGVKVCAWAGPADLSGEEKAAAARSEFALGAHYEPKSLPLAGSVTVRQQGPAEAGGRPPKTARGSRSIAVEIKVLLNLPRGVTAEQAEAVRSYVQDGCFARKIRPVWERDLRALQLDVRFVLGGDSASGEIHQDLDLIVSPEAVADADARPQLALRDWPYHSLLAPQGTAACDAKCAQAASGAARRNCQTACVEQVSEPFCRSLGKLTTHWLGMEDPMVEKGCALGEGAKHPGFEAKSLAAGYRKIPASSADGGVAEAISETAADAVPGAAGGDSAAERARSAGTQTWTWASAKIPGALNRFLSPICMGAKR